MGQIKRHALYAITGCLWLSTGGTAITDIGIKIYLYIWLALLVTSLWSLAVHLSRPDRGVLAQARLNLAAFRAEQAAEQAEKEMIVPDDPSYWVDTPPRGHRVS
jgi:hypothetical protein